jgi:hypothetical protein
MPYTFAANLGLPELLVALAAIAVIYGFMRLR